MKKIIITALMGIILFPSCKKATTDDKILPDVSGIYFDQEYELRADSVKTGYVFIFHELAGSLKQGLMVLWHRKSGDTAATFHLEGELVPTRWERDVEGRLFVEGSCDLGSPAGIVVFKGVFSEGITLAFQVISNLFPDSGTIVRASGSKVPLFGSVKKSGGTYIGNWNWQIGGGNLQSCGSMTYWDCNYYYNMPSGISGFMAVVNIYDETLGQNVNTCFGSYTAPDPLSDMGFWFYDVDFFGLVILPPFPFTQLQVGGGDLIDSNTPDTAWLPGAGMNTVGDYHGLDEPCCCLYPVTLDISLQGK